MLLPAVALGADLEERIRAAWTAQILATHMGFAFEHKVAAVERVDRLPKTFDAAPVDDDYYYEIVALRAFEEYGPRLTVEQLGRQWQKNNAGSWGSSKHTRENLAKGIVPPATGHPRYNPMWFSIGPQFSGDLYGLLAPGHPNLAGKLARELGAINGYAEGLDGGVFIAGMVSLAFVESDPRKVVEQAARLIDARSPYRQCLDLVTGMARAGKTFREVADAVEERWHLEYAATNNAVANGGLVAAAVWFGEGDFLKTANLAFQAGDFTDADCNAANAAAVVGAMKGMSALPKGLVEALHDRITGSEMGGVAVVPPLEERISDLARRTAAMAAKVVAAHPAEQGRTIRTQPLEAFALGDLMQYWNPEWRMERAGFGGGGGGMGGLRGVTALDGDVLKTWPRDEVRGVVLRRTMTLPAAPKLRVTVKADMGRAWLCELYAGNRRVLSKLVEGEWQTLEADLAPWAGRETELRLYQRVTFTNKVAGTAWWRTLVVE